MIKEIKSIILKDKENNNYFEENVLALTEHGYEVKYIDEELHYEGRWETETIYYYKIVNKATDTSIYIGVVDSKGNTEMQESEGIIKIHKVKPKEVKMIKWEIIKDED